MQDLEILNQIYDGNLTAQEGYDSLYPLFDKKALKRARFIKMRVNVKEDDSKAANTLLKVLFILPLPLVFLRIALRIAKKKGLSKQFNYNQIDQLTDAQLDELINLTKYAKHTKITVESDDADVIIKIY